MFGRELNMANLVLNQKQIMQLLDKCYYASVKGLPGQKTCEQLAYEYLNKYGNRYVAAKKLIKAQEAKCAVSGFVAGLGGLIVLPFALPANIASVMYIQMRMIGAISVIGGNDVHDDEVQTLVYVCLINETLADICKQAGVNIANKMAVNMLKKLPGEILKKINQKVGFRLLTKFGEKGAVNLVKVVPVAGGIVGGGADLLTTRLIAQKAYKTFILQDIN